MVSEIWELMARDSWQTQSPLDFRPKRLTNSKSYTVQCLLLGIAWSAFKSLRFTPGRPVQSNT